MQTTWQFPRVDRPRRRSLRGGAAPARLRWRLRVFTHRGWHQLSANLPPLPSLTAAVTLSPLHHCQFVFPFLFLLPFSCSFSLSHPLSFTGLFSLSPFIALPLSCHISVYFCQSDTGTQRFGPTHHCDSRNRLTRENKFHSKTQILMDWAVFFSPFSFLTCHALFCFFLRRPSFLFRAGALRQPSFTAAAYRIMQC